MIWMALLIASVIVIAVLWNIRENQYLKAVATSFSLIAVPVVLGVAGYQIQQEIADGAISKDYVQIAAQILTPPLPKDAAERTMAMPMRCWAIGVLDMFSPVALTEGQKADLMARGLSGGSWDVDEWDAAGWQPGQAGSECENLQKTPTAPD